MSSIVICTPSLGSVKTPYVFSLSDSIKKDFKEKNIIDSCSFTESSTISFARNMLCQMFLNSRCDWMLFIDSDIVFTYKNICKIYEEASVNKFDILSGTYNSYDKFLEKIVPVYSVLENQEKTHISKAEWFGLGFCIISRKAIEKTKKIDDYGNYYWFAESYSDKDGYIGEDIYFLNSLRNNGIDLYIDHSIKLGHSKNIILS